MTNTNGKLCGEPTNAGDPCERPAGWGTQRDHGPCIDHEQSAPVLRKFTPERRERIIGAASTGAFKKHIAQMAEITEGTLSRWVDMGETDEENDLDTDLAEFYRDWQRARGAGAIRTLQNVSDEFLAERAYGYTKTTHVDADVTRREAETETEEYAIIDAEGDAVTTEHDPLTTEAGSDAEGETE